LYNLAIVNVFQIQHNEEERFMCPLAIALDTAIFSATKQKKHKENVNTQSFDVTEICQHQRPIAPETPTYLRGSQPLEEWGFQRRSVQNGAVYIARGNLKNKLFTNRNTEAQTA